MLVAAAVCPHPPLLVPAVAGGAVAELEPLRRQARTAVRRLHAATPDLLAVVGPGSRTARHPADAAGTTAPYGVAVRVGGPGPAVLPPSLTVGAWLLDCEPDPAPRCWQEVAADLPPAAALRLGAELAAAAPRVALLVLGDGSARRRTAPPGTEDPRADDVDTEVAAALAAGDPVRLARLDPALAAELLVAGRAAWQVLAGAAGVSGAVGVAGPGPAREPGVHRWQADLLAHEAPYGVGYLVSVWQPAAGAESAAAAGRT